MELNLDWVVDSPRCDARRTTVTVPEAALADSLNDSHSEITVGMCSTFCLLLSGRGLADGVLLFLAASFSGVRTVPADGLPDGVVAFIVAWDGGGVPGWLPGMVVAPEAPLIAALQQ